MEKGMLAEVQGLVAKGYGFDLPAMSGLGYKQLGLYLQGAVDLSAAIQQIKFDTHRLARRQYNWFRLNDKRIHWFEIGKGMEGDIHRLVQRFMANQDGLRLAN